MIVVDTSVWVAALRSASSPEAAAFAALVDSDDVLLTAPVRTELLGGARAADRKPLKRLLTALPVAYPTNETWRLMDGWAELARDHGDRFGVGDLLIAALAKESGALVWSLDADFARMERLKSVDLYDPGA
jgi:predicted nucleic acid-binding protein